MLGDPDLAHLVVQNPRNFIIFEYYLISAFWLSLPNPQAASVEPTLFLWHVHMRRNLKMKEGGGIAIFMEMVDFCLSGYNVMI